MAAGDSAAGDDFDDATTAAYDALFEEMKMQASLWGAGTLDLDVAPATEVEDGAFAFATAGAFVAVSSFLF